MVGISDIRSRSLVYIVLSLGHVTLSEDEMSADAQALQARDDSNIEQSYTNAICYTA